jgi:hypothetical protein
MCTEDRNVVERLALADITLSASLDVPGGCHNRSSILFPCQRF